MFEAIVLAGGLGSRLKQVSGDIPKPLMPVANRPFLFYIFDRLVACGCTKIVLCLSFRSQYFIEQINSLYQSNIEIIFSIEPSPLGTGGAVFNALKYIDNTNFLVLNGDTYTSIDVGSFFDHSHINHEIFSIASVYVEDTSRYGKLIVNDKSYLTQIMEKTSNVPGYINSGIYFMSKTIFTDLTVINFSLETFLIPECYGRIKIYNFDEYFIDIGVPADFYKACEYFSV